MSDEGKVPDLSRLESEIVGAIKRTGWYAHLWFPIVQRETLNLGSTVEEEEIHSAIVGLVRKHVLTHSEPEGWKPPHWSPPPDIRGQILPSPGFLALVHRMPLVSPGPVEVAIEAQVAGRRKRTPVRKAPRETEEFGADLIMTELDANILQCIDHVGWYSYLWFPVVARPMLNFGSDEPEEVVHAAVLNLIRGGAIMADEAAPGEYEQWNPAPAALKTALDSEFAWSKKYGQGGQT